MVREKKKWGGKKKRERERERERERVRERENICLIREETKVNNFFFSFLLRCTTINRCSITSFY